MLRLRLRVGCPRARPVSVCNATGALFVLLCTAAECRRTEEDDEEDTMTTMTVRNDIDLDRLQATAEALESDAQLGQFTFRAGTRWEADLPPQVLGSTAVWAGCIAGAVSERVLRRKLARAGFDDIDVTGHSSRSLEDVALYPLFSEEVLQLLRQLLPRADQQQRALRRGDDGTGPSLRNAGPFCN